MNPTNISVILLNWNGKELLEENLERVYQEVNSWNHASELLLVDNGSRDGSIEYLEFFQGKYLNAETPLRIIKFDKNLGFGVANNKAVEKAKGKYLLFLNNDLYLEKGFLEPLLEQYQTGRNIFAIAPRIYRWDRKTIDDGLRYGEFHSGLFSVELETNPEKVNQSHWVTFFCGACFFCEKEKFLELGKFDPVFTPYAWEDLDLAYRAWKRGYRILYEPNAIAYHKREATTRSAFSHFSFISLMWRNKFLFMWKNLTSRELVTEHVMLLPWKLVKFTFNGRWLYVVGFFRALPKVFSILKSRKQNKKYEKLRDEEVLCISYQETLPLSVPKKKEPQLN